MMRRPNCRPPDRLTTGPIMRTCVEALRNALLKVVLNAFFLATKSGFLNLGNIGPLGLGQYVHEHVPRTCDTFTKRKDKTFEVSERANQAGMSELHASDDTLRGAENPKVRTQSRENASAAGNCEQDEVSCATDTMIFQKLRHL